jgi:hypothetical protein
MKRGEIIFSRNYKFSDGTITKKFLIVLNEATSNNPHLLLLTTSQQWKRNTSPGCYAKENYFVIQENNDWFDKNTWVLFDPIIEYNFRKELEEHFKQNLESKAFLKQETIRAIINCLKQSDDITPYQISLLESRLLIENDKIEETVLEEN